MSPSVGWGRKRLHWGSTNSGSEDIVEIFNVAGIFFFSNEISQLIQNKTMKEVKNTGNFFQMMSLSCIHSTSIISSQYLHIMQYICIFCLEAVHAG